MFFPLIARIWKCGFCVDLISNCIEFPIWKSALNAFSFLFSERTKMAVGICNWWKWVLLEFLNINKEEKRIEEQKNKNQQEVIWNIFHFKVQVSIPVLHFDCLGTIKMLMCHFELWTSSILVLNISYLVNSFGFLFESNGPSSYIVIYRLHWEYDRKAGLLIKFASVLALELSDSSFWSSIYCVE